MSAITLIGKIGRIKPAEIRGQFETREFWVDEEKERYGNTWKIEANQGSSNVLDNYEQGQRVICTCEVRGRRYQPANGEETVFNSLVLMTIRPLEDYQNDQYPANRRQQANQTTNQSATPAQQAATQTGAADDLPF